jgi:hypothetical protein
MNSKEDREKIEVRKAFRFHPDVRFVEINHKDNVAETIAQLKFEVEILRCQKEYLFAAYIGLVKDYHEDDIADELKKELEEVWKAKE